MTVEKERILRACPHFEMLSPSELGILAELSRPLRIAPGEVVFTEGDQGDSLYVLAEGEVEVLTGEGKGAVTLRTLTAPAAFGEMALIDREVRSATVRARSECLALQLTAENFTAFRKHSRDGFTLFLVNVARVLSARLRDTNHRLAGR